jgi:hypothetical protein
MFEEPGGEGWLGQFTRWCEHPAIAAKYLSRNRLGIHRRHRVRHDRIDMLCLKFVPGGRFQFRWLLKRKGDDALVASGVRRCHGDKVIRGRQFQYPQAVAPHLPLPLAAANRAVSHRGSHDEDIM